MPRVVPALVAALAVVSVGCNQSMTSPTSPTTSLPTAMGDGTRTTTIGPPAGVPPNIEPYRGKPAVPGPPPGVPTPRDTGNDTPISYDEAISGDLPEDGVLTSVGTVGIGQNTVTGTASVISGDAGTVINHDAFAFTVPAGLVVTSVSYEWALTPVEGPIGELSSAEIDYNLLAPSGSNASLNVELFDNAGLNGGMVAAFPSLLPGGAGEYELTTTGDGSSGLGSAGESLGWIVDYTWTLTVTAP